LIASPVELSHNETVLVVEDDASLRTLLAEELGDMGLDVVGASSAEEGLNLLEERAPSIIVSDLRLPGMNGVELLERVRTLRSASPPGFIVITAFGSISQAVDALEKGADDFLTKPLDLAHLRLRVQRLLAHERLKREVALHRHDDSRAFHGMFGRSPVMRSLFDEIRHVARGRGPVLVTGESGVGKELVARAIHRESARCDASFVPVNCAGIPENLVESELFGHESGSFTGASRERPGLFAEASGGTILLDEVGELEHSLQAKLLRVLQDGAVRRVGADRERKLDVRVIVATNRDLEQEVVQGRFRDDLFYRLTTFTLEVPPLREREGDLEALTLHFLQRYAREAGKVVDDLTPEVKRCLASYSFPGNIRELESIVEHAVTFATEPTLRLSDLPQRVVRGATGAGEGGSRVPAALLGGPGLLTLDELTVRYVEHVLELTGGNKRRAASLLGISRQTLYRHLGRSGR
jgi:two-component system, NtrC family, response regulator AtoC